MKNVVMAMIAIFCFGGAVEAQNVHVQGRVVDARSGEPMPFVNVALMRPADTVFMRGATTDFEGRFLIDEAAAGSYLLQATFVGYKTFQQQMEVLADLNDLEIKLEGGTTLQEVKVVADRPLYAMDGEKNMYNTKEDASIQTGTASDALQNAPGVEVDAEGNITLRGVSSVEIWINDQPSHMNEEALKQYIKTLPANAIERIEVITNPSARYSTNGGVINIVTNQTVKRNELLCVGVRANTIPSVSPWISYVWANEKVDFNIYLNGNFSDHDMGANGTTTLLDDTGAISRYQEFDTKYKAGNKGGYVGFNMNWKIDSMTNLSAWMGGYPYWSKSTNTSHYLYDEYQPVLNHLGYDESGISNGFGAGGYGGAWFEHRFDTTGRKLTLTLNGSMWGSDGTDDQTRDYAAATMTDFRRQKRSRYFSPNVTLGADYVHPFKNDIEMETGLSLGYNYNTNDQTLDSLNTAGAWDLMGLQSYSALGRAWQPQAYVTLQKRWGTFTVKAGLRGESSFMNGHVEHPGLNDYLPIDTAYVGLVPSLHLSYRTKTFANYSLSYTRRFSDPTDLLDITNFRLYDDYSFRTGNPNLLRSYTHNLEAAVSQFVPGFGMVSLSGYWRANTNEQSTMTDVASDPYYGTYLVNYTYPDNIGSSHTEGIDANIMYRPTGFFNVRLNASVYNYGYNYNGFDTNKVTYSFRINVWAKLWNKLEVFANAHYSSPRLGLYSITVPYKGVDFGLSSDFFDRQLSVYLNVNDIFGWTEWGENTIAPHYQTTGSEYFDSRFVSLGLTWRIGKMELESKARQGASDTGNTPQM
ncbi:MAG: TonB-dependent receptor family protein [Bacteroidales bacterium]|nr:TonB-dependent receptor family protein [Bacteroidales bacterium]